MSGAIIIVVGYRSLPSGDVHTQVDRDNLFDIVRNEVDMVISGQPFAQIAGRRHRRLPIQIDKTSSHAGSDPFHTLLFNLFSKDLFAAKFDRLPGQRPNYCHPQRGCIATTLAE